MKTTRPSSSTKQAKRSKLQSSAPPTPTPELRSMVEIHQARQARIGPLFGMDMEKNTFFMMMGYLFTSQIVKLCSFPSLMRECASAPEMANYIDFEWFYQEVHRNSFFAEEWCVRVAEYSSPSVLKIFYDAIVSNLKCHGNSRVDTFFTRMAIIFNLKDKVSKVIESGNPYLKWTNRIARNDTRVIAPTHEYFTDCMKMAILCARLTIIATMKPQRTDNEIYFYRLAISRGNETVIRAVVARFTYALFVEAVSCNRIKDVEYIINARSPSSQIFEYAIEAAISHNNKDMLAYLLVRNNAIRPKKNTHVYARSLDIALGAGRKKLLELVVYNTMHIPIEMMQKAIDCGYVALATEYASIISLDEAKHLSIAIVNPVSYRFLLSHPLLSSTIDTTQMLIYLLHSDHWSKDLHVELLAHNAVLPHNALQIAGHRNDTEMMSFLLDTHVFDPCDIKSAFWGIMKVSDDRAVQLAQIIYQKHPSIVTDHEFYKDMIHHMICTYGDPRGNFLLGILPTNSSPT